MRKLSFALVLLGLLDSGAASSCPPDYYFVVESGRCISRTIIIGYLSKTLAQREEESMLQEQEKSAEQAYHSDFSELMDRYLRGPTAAVHTDPNSWVGGKHPLMDIKPSALNGSELVPVRAYLEGKNIPPPGVAAYGVLALRGRPTSSSQARLLMACEAFKAYLESQVSLSGVLQPQSLMVTVWPLHHPEAVTPGHEDCKALLSDYDLYGADTAIADAERQNAHFDGDGPYLIGWSPSTTRGQPGKLVLVMDMSKLESQDSFDHVFMAWKEKVVENPNLWRNGFTVEYARLEIRDFLDHYGKEIVAAFFDKGGAEASTTADYH